MKNINWRIYVGGLTTLAFSSLICDYEGWDLVGEFSRRWGEMSLNGDVQMIRPCQLELKVRSGWSSGVLWDSWERSPQCLFLDPSTDQRVPLPLRGVS